MTVRPISSAEQLSSPRSSNGHAGREAGDRCRIYLVRHGQTVMNVQVRFRGRLDVPLNEQGREEARLVAHSLADVGLSSIYTSPLWRAREVAESISAVTGVEIRDLPGLLNVDYGEWEGLTKEECAQRDPEAWRHYRELPEEARCPGGEALADAADRVTNSLLSISERHAGQTVAAVTHGAMVRLALLRLAPPHDGKWEVPLATGSATVLEVQAGRVSLVVSPAAPVNGHPPGHAGAIAGAPFGSPESRRSLLVAEKSP